MPIKSICGKSMGTAYASSEERRASVGAAKALSGESGGDRKADVHAGLPVIVRIQIQMITIAV
jgi:hypothetical protein